MIHDDHAEVRKQICDNALALLNDLLKEQEAVVRCKNCNNHYCSFGAWEGRWSGNE